MVTKTDCCRTARHEEFTHETELFARFFRNYDAYRLAFLDHESEEDAIEEALNKRPQ